MKSLLVFSLAALATFVLGCGKSDQSQSSGGTNQPGVVAAAVNVATNQQTAGKEIEKYGHTMAQARRKAAIQTDAISVDRAIQSFQADRGENPKSLDELVTEKFLPRLPDLPAGKKYDYNPADGTVKIVDAP
jgi:hypothetical protein